MMYAGGGGCALCTRDAGEYALCAALYAGGCGGELCLPEVLEVMRVAIFCMREAM